MNFLTEALNPSAQCGDSITGKVKLGRNTLMLGVAEPNLLGFDPKRSRGSGGKSELGTDHLKCALCVCGIGSPEPHLKRSVNHAVI